MSSIISNINRKVFNYKTFSSRLIRRPNLLSGFCSHNNLILRKNFANSTTAASSNKPNNGSNNLLVGALLASAAAGGYYYYNYIHVDYDAVKKDIAEILDNDNHDDGSYGPIFVRLAWHNAGTYDKSSGLGGSEGARMRFKSEASWAANAGLATARAVLEPIKAKHPGISYSDLWSLAGNVAIEEMGGPTILFRPGRLDKSASTPSLPDGLLPDADGRDKKHKPSDHLRDVFYRMEFNDREIVALSGGHALGRCHPKNSGYWGPWTRAPTTFSNEFFKLLLSENWTLKTKHEGKPWTGPAQYEDKTGELMMLPTDIALIQDPKMLPYVQQYAKDEDLFFRDFAKAWTKLQENGVPAFQ